MRLYKRFPRTAHIVRILSLLTLFVVGLTLWHPLGWIFVAAAGVWVVGSSIKRDIQEMRSKP